MKIGIDIDGVLNNESTFLIDYGTKFSYDNQLNYSIDISKNGTHNIFNWSYVTNSLFWEMYYKIYLTSDKYIRQFSSEVVGKLHNNHIIEIITARDNHNTTLLQKDVEIYTKQWLHRNHVQYDQLIFTKRKCEYILKNKIDLMIEDNPDTILELCKHIPVICYHTPYNSYVQDKNIFRVNSWYEILNILEESSVKRDNGYEYG